MPVATVSAVAYGKLVLHTVAFPFSGVNGLLLGRVREADKVLDITDAVPLFHTHLDLTPMLQVALMQVEAHCQEAGVSIVGYYQAHDATPKGTAMDDGTRRIANRIRESVKEAVVLMVDGTRLSPKARASDPAVVMYTARTEEKWRSNAEDEGALELLPSKAHALGVANGLIESADAAAELVDFDRHLDSVALDWRNPALNTRIQESLLPSS